MSVKQEMAFFLVKIPAAVSKVEQAYILTLTANEWPIQTIPFSSTVGESHQ